MIISAALSLPVVYRYGNFAILIQSETFSGSPYPTMKNYGL